MTLTKKMKLLTCFTIKNKIASNVNTSILFYISKEFNDYYDNFKTLISHATKNTTTANVKQIKDIRTKSITSTTTNNYYTTTIV